MSIFQSDFAFMHSVPFKPDLTEQSEKTSAEIVLSFQWLRPAVQREISGRLLFLRKLEQAGRSLEVQAGQATTLGFQTKVAI